MADQSSPRMWYLEVPARDAHRSAAFYERVFGWNIRNRDSERPSFDANAGAISGAFATGRKVAADSGLLIYVWVPSVDEALARVELHGGRIVEGSHPDQPGTTCYIAKITDPGGNLIGIYHEEATP